jgi:amino acid adenylation domain-containing protein
VRRLEEWVTRQANRCPEALAIRWGEERISYGDLEERSNRLARLLTLQGCRAGDRVLLLLPKSSGTITAMLAVLKAGGVYTPLDPKNPAARVARVLEALECRCVLADASTHDLLFESLRRLGGDHHLPRVGLLESRTVVESSSAHFGLDDLAACSAAPLSAPRTALDLAHILFTSGSTGSPKGVMITHGNVIHFVEWATRFFGMTSADRVSGHSPLHFDLSTFDVYGTFAVGAALHPISPELNLLPHRLADFIRGAGLTQWFSVPSILVHMAKADAVRVGDFPVLRRLLWCGERFPTPSVIHWMRRLPHVTFTNLYGPTETTIASSHYRVPHCPADEREEIPIGQGCDGEELLVLDDDRRPVPLGEVGDLYIRGVGLSPGYWRDPERTAAAFLPGPGGNGVRLYRTGDLAKVTAPGQVVLLGRADSQVKSRGYRIELGEIESALASVEEVQESAVVAIDSDGFEGTALCCVYVPHPAAHLSPALLRQRLATMLPPYMLPTRWKTVDRLPLNQNGKVDRPRLKELWAGA